MKKTNQYMKGGKRPTEKIKILSIKQKAGGTALRNGVPFFPGLSKHWLAKYGNTQGEAK